MRKCDCGSNEPTYWLVDGYGIPLCKVCNACEGKKLKRYRTDILSNYDAEEPINPEE